MNINNKKTKEWISLEEVMKDMNLTQEEKASIENEANLYLMLSKIRKEKEYQQISNKKIAELSKIPRPEVSKILNGKTNVSILRLQALARALGKKLEIRLV